MKSLKITLTKSTIGCPWIQKRTAKALGLTKVNRTVLRPDNEQMRGMIKAIKHLVTVQAAENE
jgi:large subunit ribosomal protein L30